MHRVPRISRTFLDVMRKACTLLQPQGSQAMSQSRRRLFHHSQDGTRSSHQLAQLWSLAYLAHNQWCRRDLSRRRPLRMNLFNGIYSVDSLSQDSRMFHASEAQSIRSTAFHHRKDFTLVTIVLSSCLTACDTRWDHCSNSLQACNFMLPYEGEKALLSPDNKGESQVSASFHPNGLVACSFDSGIGTTLSFSSAFSEYPYVLPGRSFDSGLGTATCSFSNTFSDADISFNGTGYSFVEYKSSPQLGDLPAFNNWSRSSPVLAGSDLTAWPSQLYTHVAPAQTLVEST